MNLHLLTARRRDRQQRGLQAFMVALQQAAKELPSQVRMLDPETSVRIEQSFSTFVQESLATGMLVRDTELSWDQVSDRLRQQVGLWEEAETVVYLSHHEDFLFRLPFFLFAENARSLIEFDGDTVYAVSDDLQRGCGIDIYTSEIVNLRRYTVDTWG